MAPVEVKSLEGRLLLVSNRLPITIKRSEEGEYDFSMSSGGLVTGLSGLSKSTKFEWYGWPGMEIPEDEIDTLKSRLKEEYDAHPVMLDDELADKHYNGFSSTSTCKTRLCMTESNQEYDRLDPLATVSLLPW